MDKIPVRVSKDEASSLETRTGIFSKSVTLWTPLQIFFQVGYPVVIGHFAATPQSDVVRIYANDFQRNGGAFGTKENACFRAFIILRSQFHLHHCAQRPLTEIVSKITRNREFMLRPVLEDRADASDFHLFFTSFLIYCYSVLFACLFVCLFIHVFFVFPLFLLLFECLIDSICICSSTRLPPTLEYCGRRN